MIDIRGSIIPIMDLAEVLGYRRETALDPVGSAMVVQHGGRSVAIRVDRLDGQREVLVKSLGTFLPKIRHIGGAAIFGDGAVVLVADPHSIVDTTRDGRTAGRVEPAPQSTTRATPDAATVLVVDDSFPIREMERSILEAAGFSVTTATDGDEALEIARVASFDAVVPDVDMPNMNGVDLCDALRAEFPDLPVVMVTALSSELDRRRGLEAGASAYMTKSEFDQGELVDTLRELIGV